MNREIKFRVWDIKNKRWVKHENAESRTEIAYETNYLVVWINYELSQYTGLKDKNGKEIYEGDIIQFYPSQGSSIISNFNDTDPLKKSVYWNDDEAEWGWKMLSGTPEGSGFVFCKNNQDIFEVIGNIWENGDLLNDTK